MSMQTILNGGFVAVELGKINANFAEIESDYAKKTELPTVVSDLTNDAGYITAAAIPTNVSELTNDAGYVTQAALPTVPTAVSAFTNDAGYITLAALPTKTSELTNDSGFITAAAVPTNVSAFTNDAGYATTAQVQAVGVVKTDFTAASWANGKFTTAANGKMPIAVMRKNGTNYESVIVDVQVVGTNIVITADETFDGYLLTI